ncbi:hypothetical protein L1O03_09630 [Corynebacterium uropygiale]|uniref:Uncharacterized protein n=1 Tax=Corynebacterium uropygiale TaxID=1775911 RepID=A0A9X1QS84_9CORY|nr:hypothetical protein [Corynebacterium uropygiale]MCF4007427.1 hypothetical protein [Corynebacterium uropygiale]
MAENIPPFPQHPEDSPDWGREPQESQAPQAPLGSPSTIADPRRSPAHPGTIPFESTFSIAWKSFSSHWGHWVVMSLIYLIVSVIFVIADGLTTPNEALQATADPTVALSAKFTPVFIIIFIVSAIVSLIINIFFTLTVHRDLGGHPFTSYADFFRSHGFGRVLLVSIVVSIIQVVPFILLVLKPHLLWVAIAAIISLILTICFSLSAHATIVHGGVGQALMASFNVVRSNILVLIGIWVVLFIINMVLGLTIIGIVVAMPLNIMVPAVAYRIATGAPLQTSYL